MLCVCAEHWQHSSLPHAGNTQGTGWTMLQEINCCYTSSDRKVKFISIWMKLDEKDKGGLHILSVCWGNTKRPSSRRKRTPVIQLLHKHSSIPTHPSMAENKLLQQNISCFPRSAYFVNEKTVRFAVPRSSTWTETFSAFLGTSMNILVCYLTIH